jgi:RNA polymerase sigma-70 factor, ECF subfamily
MQTKQDSMGGGSSTVENGSGYDLSPFRRGANAASRNAVDELMPCVYNELRRIAANQIHFERPGGTLQPTALVHEAYLKLINQREANWQNRGHFCAIAAQEMRRILLEHARARRAQKRGGAGLQITLSDDLKVAAEVSDDAIALDEALNQLEVLDPQQARIVELRFFAELSVEETAEALGIGTATVKRDWAMARAWLLRQLNHRGSHAAAT